MKVSTPAPTLAQQFYAQAQVTKIPDARMAAIVGETRQNFAKALAGVTTAERVVRWTAAWNRHATAGLSSVFLMVMGAGDELVVTRCRPLRIALIIEHEDGTLGGAIAMLDRAHASTSRLLPGVHSMRLVGMSASNRLAEANYDGIAVNAMYAEAALLAAFEATGVKGVSVRAIERDW